MTLFQMAVLTLLALNVSVTYYMLRRLAIATLTGSFVVAHWLNPVRAKWFKEEYQKMLAAQGDEDEELASKLAEENSECPHGREALIAGAFNAYKECRRIPKDYRDID